MANLKNKLLKYYQQLDERGRLSLLDYAEYLQQKSNRHEIDEKPQQPNILERPQEESVVAAIKRLKTSYYMLDTDLLLNETSALMAQFMVQGRSAEAVIDDLHILFENQYEKYLNHD